MTAYPKIKPMKCFLHIGTEKTATTTIQRFFNANREKILEKGFIFTKNAGETDHRFLPVIAYDRHKRDDLTEGAGVDTDDELETFQRKTISSLSKEIETTQKKYKNAEVIVFSSEHIQSRLIEIREIERLKAVLHDLGISDINVIVYLRRPAEIACSLYSTLIKNGAIYEIPPLPNIPYWNNICNHKKTIEKFGTVFGKSSIIPRLFDKYSFVNGSIIDDILSVVGIPNDNYEIPSNANESLSQTGVEILRRLNKTIPMWTGNKQNELRANLNSYIEKHFSDGKYIMPASMYAAYDSEFQESNEWVRQNYFPNREILFPSTIPEEVLLSMPDSEINRVVDLITSIWHDKQNEIINLKKQVHLDNYSNSGFDKVKTSFLKRLVRVFATDRHNSKSSMGKPRIP